MVAVESEFASGAQLKETAMGEKYFQKCSGDGAEAVGVFLLFFRAADRGLMKELWQK